MIQVQMYLRGPHVESNASISTEINANVSPRIDLDSALVNNSDIIPPMSSNSIVPL